jgi:hypothetical protein
MPRCVRCSQKGLVHAHHLTLRDSDGQYHHPLLTVDLDPPCHQGLHRILQRADLERVEVITPAVDLGRVAACLSWLAWQWPGRAEVVVLPVELVRGIAGVLEEVVRDLREAA